MFSPLYCWVTFGSLPIFVYCEKYFCEHSFKCLMMNKYTYFLWTYTQQWNWCVKMCTWLTLVYTAKKISRVFLVFIHHKQCKKSPVAPHPNQYLVLSIPLFGCCFGAYAVVFFFFLPFKFSLAWWLRRISNYFYVYWLCRYISL